MHHPIRTALLLAATALAPLAQAGELTLYTHINFGGPALSLRGTTPTLVPYDFNDRASSLVVRSGSWEVCEHVDFGGRCLIVERGEYPVLEGFNDVISSAREVAPRQHREGYEHGHHHDRDDDGDRDRYEGDDDYRPRQRQVPVVLFEHQRFEGRAVELRGDVRNLESYDFNDVTGSIVINEGQWEACVHADFGGQCVLYGPGRYAHLDMMNNKISSLRRVR